MVAAIAAGSNGDNTVVAGVAGQSIRVLGFLLSFGGTVNAKWRSGATDRTGLVYGLAGVQAPSPALPAKSPQGPPAQFATAGGADLVLNLSGAVAVGGYVVYEFVSPNLA